MWGSSFWSAPIRCVNGLCTKAMLVIDTDAVTFMITRLHVQTACLIEQNAPSAGAGGCENGLCVAIEANRDGAGPDRPNLLLAPARHAGLAGPDASSAPVRPASSPAASTAAPC